MKIKLFNEFFFFPIETPRGDVSLNVFHNYDEWKDFYEENRDIMNRCYWSFVPHQRNSEGYFNMYVKTGSVFAVIIDKSATPAKVIGAVVKDGGILSAYDQSDKQLPPGEFQKYLSMLGMDIEDVEGFNN